MFVRLAAVGPGALVAAVFEDDFYVGEVEERRSSDNALVNFMCRCAGKDTVYKWPVSLDRNAVYKWQVPDLVKGRWTEHCPEVSCIQASVF